MARPSFSLAWDASQRIYDPTNSGEKVAKTIGELVEKNINNPDTKQKWNNTCTVRMSYILNQAEMVIPKIPGQTVSGADYCYFNEPGARYLTARANFWSLP